MHQIRPYKLFTLLDCQISERLAHVPIPSRRGTGGVSLLEAFLLIAATRVVSATRIFEFGTFIGSTTLIFALNTPNDARIFTLDLDQPSASGLSQDAYDAPLTELHLSAASNLDFSDSPMSYKIEALFGNSREFDCSPWTGTIDLTFIDGGHDVLTAGCDTTNALRMANPEKPSFIIWHDYRNPEYPALTEYLDGLSTELEMFHVEDTKLCFCFQGPHDSFRKQILASDR